MFDRRHCFMKAGDLYGYLQEGIPYGHLVMLAASKEVNNDILLLFKWIVIDDDKGINAVRRSISLREFYFANCTMKEFAEQILKSWVDAMDQQIKTKEI